MTIDNWIKVLIPQGCIYYGDLDEDDKGRGFGGWPIRTSLVVDTSEKKEGDVIYTVNSVYTLGKPNETNRV